MVTNFHRPPSLSEAVALRSSTPASAYLAGGTSLLAGPSRGPAIEAISVAHLLDAGISADGGSVRIGSGATFQAIADSAGAPPALRLAALGMANRNIRMRATIGGNISAGRACASLMPPLLALGASLEVEGVSGRRSIPLESYDPASRELILSVTIHVAGGRGSGYARWSRTACDLSILSAAAAMSRTGGKASGVRVALGGLDARARRYPGIEALLEGSAFPEGEALAKAIEEFLEPISDARGGADFKRHRAAVLAVDAMRDAWEASL